MKNLLGAIALRAVPLAIIVACCHPIDALASPVVRTIKQTQASGQFAKLQTINVWSGHGVVISFYEVREKIQRVWLDDPSQILIDTDGCLKGIDQDCPNPGAGLIHLRRIKKVNIPGLPQTPSTLLTVITQTESGERKAYSFRLAASSGSPKYSQVVIINDVVNQDKKVPSLQPLVITFKNVRELRNGLNIAIRNKWLRPSDELHQRLQRLITYLQQGMDINTAADKAVVSIQLVHKLTALGSSSPFRKTRGGI
ncbi:hypothetical protein [Dendronalium sp. ChiSLP03b]|uniref:hypothetical protein n=1 Tax=Dendronalium sp. ChiSLP03b TaxID=3075381 RepID=UPI002AD29DF0|nr:hypothetical protein [Dendronalium sp. ChiSLP03b]MDZ8203525.1 hypothetical protein [Dendronalium sp. ChiSLP03b]